ncbi:hypothetical protein [Streptomyces sp. NPDC046197]|uniref:hypothetical protein n=1 Tax=Streptomyces sp. NPDC046197 TaxID=3154337 RepID=UPI0033D6CFEC
MSQRQLTHRRRANLLWAAGIVSVACAWSVGLGSSWGRTDDANTSRDDAGPLFGVRHSTVHYSDRQIGLSSTVTVTPLGKSRGLTTADAQITFNLVPGSAGGQNWSCSAVPERSGAAQCQINTQVANSGRALEDYRLKVVAGPAPQAVEDLAVGPVLSGLPPEQTSPEPPGGGGRNPADGRTGRTGDDRAGQGTSAVTNGKRRN